MNPEQLTIQTLADRLRLIGQAQRAENQQFAADVQAGLQSVPKQIPCRYLYDDRGSRLFELICRTPEYYLTRAEREIVRARAGPIAAGFAEPFTLVELGSGSAAKTRLLIEAALRQHSRLRYVPLDISTPALTRSAQALLAQYPGLDILAIAAEYNHVLRALPPEAETPRLIAFLGSSIGNFERAEAAEFLGQIGAQMNGPDRLLVGIDLRKPAEVLRQAYDDAQGVTARFNLNLLARINRELGGTFDRQQFSHQIRYAEAAGRIEMHLRSSGEQEVEIIALRQRFHFAAAETIRTEHAYKYSLAEIETLATEAGLVLAEQWFDSARRFSLNLLRRGGD